MVVLRCCDNDAVCTGDFVVQEAVAVPEVDEKPPVAAAEHMELPDVEVHNHLGIQIDCRVLKYEYLAS